MTLLNTVLLWGDFEKAEDLDENIAWRSGHVRISFLQRADAW